MSVVFHYKKPLFRLYLQQLLEISSTNDRTLARDAPRHSCGERIGLPFSGAWAQGSHDSLIHATILGTLAT